MCKLTSGTHIPNLSTTSSVANRTHSVKSDPEHQINMANSNSEMVVKTTDDMASSLLELLGAAFHELEACGYASEDKVCWVEIQEHFRDLQSTLKKKFEELEVREKEFEGKKYETLTLLDERETVVATKEQGFFDRIQELKDAAVVAISEARATYSPPPVLSECGDHKESKVRSSLDVSNVPTAENVQPRPELTHLCEQMDANGLLRFGLENIKNVASFRVELSIALGSASEPARLVLDSLYGFYPSGNSSHQGEESDVVALQGLRQSCLLFLEALSALLAIKADNVLNHETKQQAKAIADGWKPKLAGACTANPNSLEIDAFLQLLATFNIASEFDVEELCKLVLVVAHNKRAPELCRSLGLTHKMPDVIQELIDSGKQINAVYFIHKFQLGERFSPVPILETYLQDATKNPQGSDGNNLGLSGSQNHPQELTALKAVISCVENCKLEPEYPLEPLLKRITHLEKSNAEKNPKVGVFGKSQRKKQRSKGRFYRSRASGFGSHRNSYTGMSERYPSNVAPSPYYQIPNQPMYSHQVSDQRPYYYAQDDKVPSVPSNYGSYAAIGPQPSQQPYM